MLIKISISNYVRNALKDLNSKIGLKKPYKARFIANSSSCTTTERSKLLTSCLTAVKNMLSNIVKKYMRDPVKTYFGRLKIQVKF